MSLDKNFTQNFSPKYRVPLKSSQDFKRNLRLIPGLQMCFTIDGKSYPDYISKNFHRRLSYSKILIKKEDFREKSLLIGLVAEISN